MEGLSASKVLATKDVLDLSVEKLKKLECRGFYLEGLSKPQLQKTLMKALVPGSPTSCRPRKNGL